VSIMRIDLSDKDKMHEIAVKFTNAFLPSAKKPYNLKAVLQPELDVHGIASKAAIFNIKTDPHIIEEGLTVGMNLMFYLLADGYRIKTPLFNMKIGVPGEYSGNETRLPDGLYPTVNIQPSAAIRRYIKDRVELVFAGFENTDGFIGEAIDEATGLVDKTATIGKLLTIHGYGLKIESDGQHKDEVGLYFEKPDTHMIKADNIAINEPRTLRVVVPTSLVPGERYQLHLVTQGSAKSKRQLLKETREMSSRFAITANE